MNLRKGMRRIIRDRASSIGAALATVYPPDSAGDRQLEQTLERLNQLPGTGLAASQGRAP